MKFLPLLFILACSQAGSDAVMTTPDNPTASAYTYLALGDSYTIGESVPAADRWSVQLAELLRNDGLDVGEPDIIARTGWTTAELQTAIRKIDSPKKYSLVSLLIGVNNQYRGQSVDQYRTEFRELLQTAVRFANGRPKHVFVLSIPDWGVTPYAASRDRQQIAREIDTFNAVAQEECKKAEIAYVDITPLSRKVADDASQVAGDGLHYSGKQYRQWATQALPVAKAAVK